MNTLSRVFLLFTISVSFLLVGARHAIPNVEWSSYAGSNSATKFSPIKLAKPIEASSLSFGWSWESPDNPKVLMDADEASMHVGEKIVVGVYQSTPIYVDGRLFVSSSLGVVAALDPKTGAELWSFDPETEKYFETAIDLTELGGEGTARDYPPNLGYVHRGVSYWTNGSDKRIIFGTADARMIILNAENGDLVHDIDLTQNLSDSSVNRSNYAVTSPPSVCGDVAIVGASIRDITQEDKPNQGHVRGYNIRTGEMQWRFESIPTEESSNAHKASWEEESWRSSGNTNVWTYMSNDGTNAYLPFSTPNRDFFGGLRPGDNLYAESIVAVNCETGEKVWHQQLVRHGIWDYDIPAAPILADLDVDGEGQKQVLFQVTKQGHVYSYDRTTKDPLWPMKEINVPQSDVPGEKTAATQRVPTKPVAFDAQGIDFNEDLLGHHSAFKGTRWEMILNDWAKKQMVPLQVNADTPLRDGPLFMPPSLEGTIMVPGFRGGASWSGATLDPSGGLYVGSETKPTVISLEKKGEIYGRSLSRTKYLPEFTMKPKPTYGRVTKFDMTKGEKVWEISLNNEYGERLISMLKDPAEKMGLEGVEPLTAEEELIVREKLGNIGAPRRIFAFMIDGVLFAYQQPATGVRYLLSLPHVAALNPGLKRLPVYINFQMVNGKLTPQGKTYYLGIQHPEGYVPTLYAIDPDTGVILKEFTMPDSALGSPMVYRHEGDVYIAFPTGGAGKEARIISMKLQ